MRLFGWQLQRFEEEDKDTDDLPPPSVQSLIKAAAGLYTSAYGFVALRNLSRTDLRLAKALQSFLRLTRTMMIWHLAMMAWLIMMMIWLFRLSFKVGYL